MIQKRLAKRTSREKHKWPGVLMHWPEVCSAGLDGLCVIPRVSIASQALGKAVLHYIQSQVLINNPFGKQARFHGS